MNDESCSEFDQYFLFSLAAKKKAQKIQHRSKIAAAGSGIQKDTPAE